VELVSGIDRCVCWGGSDGRARRKGKGWHISFLAIAEGAIRFLQGKVRGKSILH
jgi:hypothetical protein